MPEKQKLRDKAQKAAERARARAEEAARAARDTGRKARASASQGLERNPLAAIASGLALGAIVASLLPRTAREDALVGDVGRKARAKVKHAAKAARNQAKAELDELGLNVEAARDQVRELVRKAGKAAVSAGNAAADTVRRKDDAAK
jgi:ElaB/YqjD/DUF883 family membrane-anchored ribosome-binding protein